MTFWRVEEASAMRPPERVERLVTERVSERVAAPETPRVPVAERFVAVTVPATMTEEEAYILSLNQTGMVVVGVSERVL